MTLFEVYTNYNMSRRTFNVCRENYLDSARQILTYYIKNKNFLSLKNCGKKSNEELISICEKLYSFIETKDDLCKSDNNINKTQEQDLDKSHPIKNIISKRLIREIINYYIDINTKNLSVRSKNALSSYLEGNFDVRNFIDKLVLDRRFNISEIKNIGMKSIYELKKYISKIEEFIISFEKKENEFDLISLKNKLLIQVDF